MSPRRVVIVGSGGAGKSTLARELGARLGIPVHHLDQLFWKAGWVAVEKEEFVARQARILEEPAWIIDGNFGETIEARLAAADLVIVMALPTAVCLWGAVRRYVKYRGRTRPDMTEGNPEKIDWEYLEWIWTFRKKRLPKTLGRLKGLRADQRSVVLQSRAEVAEFVASLSAPTNH